MRKRGSRDAMLPRPRCAALRCRGQGGGGGRQVVNEILFISLRARASGVVLCNGGEGAKKGEGVLSQMSKRGGPGRARQSGPLAEMRVPQPGVAGSWERSALASRATATPARPARAADGSRLESSIRSSSPSPPRQQTRPSKPRHCNAARSAALCSRRTDYRPITAMITALSSQCIISSAASRAGGGKGFEIIAALAAADGQQGTCPIARRKDLG